MEQNTRSFMVTGRPGVGKSYMGNFLLTQDPHSQVFLSESDPEGFGVTKEIQVKKSYAQHLGRSIEFIDVPGSGDPTIDIEEVAQSLVKQLQNKTINAALMLVAAQDDRATVAEVLTISFLKNFFSAKGIDTKEALWLVITRCQEKKPDEKFIQGKINYLKRLGLEFDSTVQSIRPFIQEVFSFNEDQGLQVENNVEQALVNFSKDLNDVRMKDPCINQEFQNFVALARMIVQTVSTVKRLSNKELRKKEGCKIF